MPICPHGHNSQTTDYCDYCGTPIPGQQSGAVRPPQPPAGQPLQPAGQTAGLPVCPICATPRTGRYCEECGYDWDLNPQPAGAPGAPTGQPPHPLAQPGGPYPGQPGAPQQPPMGQPFPPASQHPLAQPGQSYPGQPGQPGQPYPGQPGGQPYPAQPGQPGGQPPAQPGPPPGGSFGGYVTGHTGGAGSGSGNTEYHLAPPSGGYVPQAADPFGGQQSQQPASVPAYRGTWIAVVQADREYFQEMMARSGPDASGLYFPPYSPERRVPMTGQGQLRIGRRSHQRGTVPEIDLSIAPEDPGASHSHALLQEQPDGRWVVIDQDSTNGTTLNGAADPLPPYVPVELKDGDRIHVGAWTTITVHCA